MRIPRGGIPRNPQGRAMQADFATGMPYRNQLVNIKNVNNQAADEMQKALLNLIGQDVGASGAPNIHVNSLRNDLNRMAGSDATLMALRAVPAATALMAGSTAADLVTGDETLANRGMDLLGMGTGAFGMHLGRVGGTTTAGRALAALAGGIGGKSLMDSIQGFGGMN